MSAYIGRAVLAAAGALTLAACASGGTLTEPVTPSGQQGTIQVTGDTLPVTTTRAVETRDGVRVSLRRVEQDSRCPTNATCVWEGDAAVALRFERQGTTTDVTLHTSPRIGATSVVVGGVEFRLFGLTPYPVAGQPMPEAGAYTAFLVMKR